MDPKCKANKVTLIIFQIIITEKNKNAWIEKAQATKVLLYLRELQSEIY